MKGCDQDAYSKVSRPIASPIGTAKSHPTYVSKLTISKKIYRDCVVSESSTNDIGKPKHSISCRQPISPTTENFSNTQDKIQEFAR